jgi:hypothetical protein
MSVTCSAAPRATATVDEPRLSESEIFLKPSTSDLMTVEMA